MPQQYQPNSSTTNGHRGPTSHLPANASSVRKAILEEFPFDWGLKDSTLSLRQEHWKHWCRFLEHNAKPMESATPELFLQYAQEFSDMAALKDYLCTIRDRCQQKKIFGLDAHSQKMLEDVQRRARFLVDARCRKKALPIDLDKHLRLPNKRFEKIAFFWAVLGCRKSTLCSFTMADLPSRKTVL